MLDDYLTIKKEIEGKSLKNVQKDDLSISLRINQNPSQNSIEKIQNTVQFKIDCLDNLYDEYRVYCRNLVSDEKFENKFQKKIEENIKSGTKLFNDINFAIKSIDNYFNQISITSELSRIFIDQKSSFYFGRIYNNFDQEVIENTSSSYKTGNFLNTNKKSYIKINDKYLIDNFNVISDKLILNLSELFDLTGLNYNINQVNITNLISQQLINLARSMSTISTGCFLDVESNIDFSNILPIKEKICVSSENNDIEFFKYITADNLNFDYREFLNDNQEFFTVLTQETTFNRRLQNPGNSMFASQNDFINVLWSNVYHCRRLFDHMSRFNRYNSNTQRYETIMSTQDEINNLNQINNIFFDIFNVNLDLNQNTTFKKYILNKMTETLDTGDVLTPTGNATLNFLNYRTIIGELSTYDPDLPVDYFSTNIPSENHKKVYSTSLLNINSVYNEEYENILDLEPTGSPSSTTYEYDYHSSLKLNNDQIVNRNFNLDYKELSLKVDSIVKKIKIKSLQNENVNIDLIQHVVSKINSKTTKNKLISYHKDANPNISLIEDNDLIFNVLFGKDDDEKIYSNFETKRKNNVNSVVDKISNDIETNTNASDFYDDYKNIVLNYYKGKYFKSSFIFLKKVVSDVLVELGEESLSTNQNFLKYSLCQFLYFNYILNENKDIKNANSITKRFVANSIKKYGNCSQLIKNNKLDTFAFNKDDYELTDYNVYSDEITEDDPASKLTRKKQEEFEKKYFKTSDDLNNIIKSVFSNDNILNSSKHTCKSKVGNIKINLEASEDFVNSINNYSGAMVYSISGRYLRNAELGTLRGFESLYLRNSDGSPKTEGTSANDGNTVYQTKTLNSFLQNDLTLAISFEKIKNIIPFVFTKSKYTNTDGDFSQYKNYKLKSKIITPFSHTAEVTMKISGRADIANYIFQKNSNDFNFNVNISTGGDSEGIVIGDYFDNLCQTKNNFIFSSILESIYDAILTLDNSLLDRFFNSESDIIDYIDNNSHILEIATDILSVYGEVYNNAILRYNEEITDFVFASDALYSSENEIHLSKYNNTEVDPTMPRYTFFGQNRWQIPNFYSYFYDNGVDRDGNIIPVSLFPLENDYRNAQNDLRNYEKLELANEVFNESIQNSNYQSIIRKREFRSILQDALDIVINDYETLFSSFNFLYQDIEFNNSVLQSLSSQERLDRVDRADVATIDVKSRYIENIFMSLNTLLKSDAFQSITFDLINMFFSFYKDKIITANKQDIFKDLDFLNNKIDKTNIFEVVSNEIVLNQLYYYNDVFKSFLSRQKEISIGGDPSINPETSLISPAIEIIKKEKKFFLDLNEVATDINLYKGELYCLSLNKNTNINANSLIKIKAEVFEHGNINKIYYPKYFYFSPLIFNAPYSEYISNINDEPDTHDLIGIFNNFTLDDKISIHNRSSLDLANILSPETRVPQDFDHLKDIIKEQFNIEDSDTILRIFNSIIDNHARSFKLSKVVNSIYNINLNDIFKKDILSESFYNMILDINSNLFYNTFGHTKEEFLNNCIINDEGTFKLDFSNKKYFKATDFLSNLNYITSLENQIHLINNITESLYQNIFWDLDLSDFKFRDYKKTREPSESYSSSVRGSSEGEILVNQDISDSLESFFIEKDLNREIDITMKQLLSTKLINYENYSISITVEVV